MLLLTLNAALLWFGCRQMRRSLAGEPWGGEPSLHAATMLFAAIGVVASIFLLARDGVTW